MRTLLSLTLLFISACVNGQIKTQLVAGASLPKNIRFLGKPVQAIKFQDNTGSYLALTTQTGEQSQKGDD